MPYYDDNFGHWEIRDEEDLEFYRHCQRTNVRKVCAICGHIVMIQPQYDKCNDCADKIEKGYDV